MATTTVKSTYSLDVESVQALEDLARRWRVSKSEALRFPGRITANLLHVIISVVSCTSSRREHANAERSAEAPAAARR